MLRLLVFVVLLVSTVQSQLLLWNQAFPKLANGFISTDFNNPYLAVIGADDFQVAAEKIWLIDSIEVHGFFNGAGPVVFGWQVKIYSNQATQVPSGTINNPGNVIWQKSGVFPEGGDPKLEIPKWIDLVGCCDNPPPLLYPGRYWISAYPEVLSGEIKADESWYWNFRNNTAVGVLGSTCRIKDISGAVLNQTSPSYVANTWVDCANSDFFGVALPGQEFGFKLWGVSYSTANVSFSVSGSDAMPSNQLPSWNGTNSSFASSRPEPSTIVPSISISDLISSNPSQGESPPSSGDSSSTPPSSAAPSSGATDSPPQTSPSAPELAESEDGVDVGLILLVLFIIMCVLLSAILAVWFYLAYRRHQQLDKPATT